MVESKIKSGTFREIKKRTPGGRPAKYYTKRNIKKAVCGICGSLLQGIKHQNNLMRGKLSKTQRRPERAFGGVMCSKCSREQLKKRARSLK